MHKSLMIAPQHVSIRIKEVEKLSICQRAHVACVLTDRNDKFSAFGYNRNIGTGCDHPEVMGGCGCLHAEVVAAIHLTQNNSRLPVKAYVSRAPCGPCAKVLAELGVKEVYSFDESRPMHEGFAVMRFNGMTHNFVKHAS